MLTNACAILIITVLCRYIDILQKPLDHLRDSAISSVSLGPDCNMQCSPVATEAERTLSSSSSDSFVSLGEVLR